MADTAAIAARAKPDAAPSPALTREALSAFLDGHWPDIGVDQSDSTWLECSCGWDSSKKGSDDWVTHLERALLTGYKAEAPLPPDDVTKPEAWAYERGRTGYAGVRTKERTNAEDRRTIKEAVAKRRETPTSTREET